MKKGIMIEEDLKICNLKGLELLAQNPCQKSNFSNNQYWETSRVPSFHILEYIEYGLCLFIGGGERGREIA